MKTYRVHAKQCFTNHEDSNVSSADLRPVGFKVNEVILCCESSAVGRSSMPKSM